MTTLIAAGAFVILPVLTMRVPRAGFAWFVIGFLLTAVPAFSDLGIDGRILSMLSLIVFTLFIRGNSQSSFPATWSPTSVGTPAFAFVPLGLLSLAWSTAPTETIAFTASWCLLVAAFILFRDHLTLYDIQTVLLRVFAVSIATSLFLLVLPNSAGWNFDHSRFQGIYNNPNFLALSCMFATAMSLSLRSRASIPTIAIGVLLTVLSGSRAGLASIAIVLVVFFIVALKSRWVALAGVLIGILAGAAALFLRSLADTFSDSVLFRNTDSRTSFWSEALDIIGLHWPIGSGAGTGSAAYTASSFLLVLVDLGIFGCIAALVSIFFLAKASWRVPSLSPLIVAALANAVFESWLFTPGSAFAVALWLLCAFALLRRSSESGNWVHSKLQH